MRHEDSVSSVPCEDESASISSIARNKGSKASSTQLKQNEASVGSVFQEEERIAISVGSHSTPRIASVFCLLGREGEIIEHGEPNIHRNQILELVFPQFEVSEQEEAAIATIVNEHGIQCNSQIISISTSNDDQTDDIDSEVNHYMDALHMIESEYETDPDCQMRQMVEQFFSSDDNTRVAVEELTSQSTDQHSNVWSDVFSDKEMPQQLAEAASSEISVE